MPPSYYNREPLAKRKALRARLRGIDVKKEDEYADSYEDLYGADLSRMPNSKREAHYSRMLGLGEGVSIYDMEADLDEEEEYESKRNEPLISRKKGFENSWDADDEREYHIQKGLDNKWQYEAERADAEDFFVEKTTARQRRYPSPYEYSPQPEGLARVQTDFIRQHNRRWERNRRRRPVAAADPCRRREHDPFQDSRARATLSAARLSPEVGYSRHSLPYGSWDSSTARLSPYESFSSTRPEYSWTTEDSLPPLPRLKPSFRSPTPPETYKSFSSMPSEHSWTCGDSLPPLPRMRAPTPPEIRALSGKLAASLAVEGSIDPSMYDAREMPSFSTQSKGGQRSGTYVPDFMPGERALSYSPGVPAYSNAFYGKYPGCYDNGDPTLYEVEDSLTRQKIINVSPRPEKDLRMCRDGPRWDKRQLSDWTSDALNRNLPRAHCRSRSPEGTASWGYGTPEDRPLSSWSKVPVNHDLPRAHSRSFSPEDPTDWEYGPTARPSSSFTNRSRSAAGVSAKRRKVGTPAPPSFRRGYRAPFSSPPEHARGGEGGPDDSGALSTYRPEISDPEMHRMVAQLTEEREPRRKPSLAEQMRGFYSPAAKAFRARQRVDAAREVDRQVAEAQKHIEKEIQKACLVHQAGREGLAAGEAAAARAVERIDGDAGIVDGDVTKPNVTQAVTEEAPETNPKATGRKSTRPRRASARVARSTRKSRASVKKEEKEEDTTGESQQ